ncbi:MAG: prepilin-type N-terminal cleavage/methylation domain-containing protein [Phycisphaerales bacterium]|nr:prepilin-type N-terminal cleavage/methylation domain-containing protein [Phycisphaerales bacterium]
MRRALTLVELVVVLGIISILVAISFPAVSAMWQDGVRSDAETQLSGWLRSARMRAMGRGETGVFFYIDNGVQKGVFIESEIGDDPDPVAPPNYKLEDTADRFKVLPGDVFTIGEPFRVTPLAVLPRPTEMPPGVWDDTELGNEDVTDMDNLSGGRPGAQNHRNFFTIVFSPEGRLVVGRSVLIHEEPVPIGGGKFIGKTTAMKLANAGKPELGNGQATIGFPTGGTLPDMVSGESGAMPVALNFPSVDGLLLYDDAMMRSFPDGPVNDSEQDKRDYLRRDGRPYYITVQRGAVVRGPLADPGDAG